MQASQSAGPSRRVVGLPSNPRQGRVIDQGSQQAEAPAPVQARTTRPAPSTSGQRRAQVRPLPASRPSPAPVSRPSPAPASRPSPAPAPEAGSSKPPRSVKLASTNPRSDRRNGLPPAPVSNVSREPSGPAAISQRPPDDPPTWPPKDGIIEKEDEEPAPVVQDYQGLTAPLWNTVVSVANIASNLTLNVKIPWPLDSNDDGEDTPVGTESRLTQALKSYHLSKAQTHKDLPDWLFSEKERRSEPVVVARNSQSSDEGQATTTYQPRAKAVEVSKRERDFSGKPVAPTRSLGAERLKALRERRRFEAGM